MFSCSVLSDCMTPWTTELQASLSFTNSWSLLKLMYIELVMLSKHFILYWPLLLLPSVFPSIKVFLMSQLFALGGQSIGASALASVLPMNIQHWFPLGRTGLVSLQSIGLLTVLSNTIIQKHQSFGSQPSLQSNFQKQKLLRGGKNIYKNCTKKDLHDPDNYDGVVTCLKPDILECEVKWTLENIT